MRRISSPPDRLRRFVVTDVPAHVLVRTACGLWVAKLFGNDVNLAPLRLTWRRCRRGTRQALRWCVAVRSARAFRRTVCRARQRATAGRAGITRSHGVRRARARAAAPDPADRALESRSFRRREDGRVLRWIHVQPNHVGRFGLGVGIIGLHVSLEPVRLQPSPLPRVCHVVVIDPQQPRELAGTPERAPVRWRRAHLLKNPRFHRGCQDRWRQTVVPGLQPGEAVVFHHSADVC
jgi:hypothetical protein